MLLKDFAKTGRKVSEIGMGTYYDSFWTATAFVGWRRGAKAKEAAIRAGLDGGMTLVDTAEIYGSEPLVARALNQRKRDEVFVATKVWPNHLHSDALSRSFDRSLRRLGTSYIDLYQVHFPNPRVPIGETMGALEKLVEEGKLMHIGVSNFSLEQIQEAQSSMSKAELSSVQIDYSLFNRRVEADILPYCDGEKIALLAYYPLGHGKLVSDSRLDVVGSRLGKTRSQVALRWLARKANVFPIPRASGKEHVTEDLAASDWELPEPDAAEVDARFR
jgi:diketogulonate reductase-like aldo/keto reductase